MPDAGSIPGRALETSERHPDVEAIVDGGVRITYAQLADYICDVLPMNATGKVLKDELRARALAHSATSKKGYT
jgi:hypothetical protein